MALFSVDGWNLKQDTVAVAGAPDKKKQKREKAKAKRLEKAVANQDKDGEEETEKEAKKDVKNAALKPEKKQKEAKNPKKRKLESQEEPAIEKPVPTTQKLTPLQQKMMAKLSGSRFRWINEQLYTITSADALALVKDQPELFDEYHQGFRSQVQSWPENPVDVFVDQIRTRGSSRQINAPGGLPGLPNKQVVIADMGCGEAQLALDVTKFTEEYNQQGKKKKKSAFQNGGPKNLDIKVHSFDLKKGNERITVADIKNVPLEDNSCTVVIFCLALMGTNFLDFIEEAYRILAPGGELWIAEIKSRFTESAAANGRTLQPEEIGAEFVDAMTMSGFFHKKTDNDNKMFTRFEFFKPPKNIIAERKAKLERKKRFVEKESEREKFEQRRSEKPEGEWLLKPCIYKRR